jgi:D-sedoheptulose 7-phosphate isomerase
VTRQTIALADPLIDRHVDALATALAEFRPAAQRLAWWGRRLAGVLVDGGRLLVAGNGGSAAEAAHLAGEFVGRMRDDRPAYSAIALGADPATLTALGNDYGFTEVFARQVQAHGRPGDVLLAMSTSGRSPNLLAAADAARAAGLVAWALTGPPPNPLAQRCDDALSVVAADAQTVQELHLVCVHLLCAQVEAALEDGSSTGGEPR